MGEVRTQEIVPVVKSKIDFSEGGEELVTNKYTEVGFVDDSNRSLLATIVECKDMSCLSVRQKIDRVEQALLKLPQADMPVSHSFTDGLYIRSFTIPKGVMLTSKYHKLGQFDVMLTGRKTVVSDEGIIEMVAPLFGVSKPGLKRLAYAHETVLWADIHANPTNERDIDKLEDMLYADTYEDMLKYEVDKYRKDFITVLTEYNLTETEVRDTSENLNDQVEINLEEYNLKISTSLIEGYGIFATCFIPKGEIIAPVAVSNMRTQVGRYTNHSCEPNAEMHFNSSEGWLIALRSIENEEITIDYRKSRAILLKEN